MEPRLSEKLLTGQCRWRNGITNSWGKYSEKQEAWQLLPPGKSRSRSIGAEATQDFDSHH